MKNKINKIQKFKQNFWKRNIRYLVVGYNQNLCYIEGYNINNKPIYYIEGLLFSEIKRFKKSLGFGNCQEGISF